MGFLLDWLHALISLVLLLALAELMLPDGSMRPYVRVILGVVLAVAVIRPFVQLGTSQWSLPALTLPQPSGSEPVADGRRLALALEDRARREVEAQAALQAARLVELRLGVRPASTAVELAPDGWVERIRVVLGKPGTAAAAWAADGGPSDETGEPGGVPPASHREPGRSSEGLVAVSVPSVEVNRLEPVRVGDGAPRAAGTDVPSRPAADGYGELREQVRALLAGFYQVSPERVQVEP